MKAWVDYITEVLGMTIEEFNTLPSRAREEYFQEFMDEALN